MRSPRGTRGWTNGQKACGFHLAEDPAPEIQPWGYAVEIDGALVWTDDLVLD